MKKIIYIVSFLLIHNLIQGQINVDDTSYTVQELVEDILVNSPCAKVSNFSSSTGTDFGINGIGYFEENGSGFEIDRGIILSTGRAKSAQGPNGVEALSEGSDTSWGGDSDLSSITSTSGLHNATYIQFDFVPTIDFISFDFLFASEEYTQGFPCQFSDVFAFILTDSSGNSENLAVVPNTDPPVPVKVTTINEGVDFNGDGEYTLDGECAPKNPSYYNKTVTPGSSSPIDFNGYTKVLTASGFVTPGETYTIKLVIAENTDGAFDSAVFLKAESFNLGGDLGEDRTVANGNPGCEGTPIVLDANIGAGASYSWFKNGQPVAPGDGTTVLAGGSQLSVMQPGTYNVHAVLSGECQTTDDVVIEFVTPPLIAQSPMEIMECDIDGNGKELFDLTANASRILGTQNASDYVITYHESEEDANEFKTANVEIDTPSSYENLSEEQTIWIRIADHTQTCFEVASFEIKTIVLDVTSQVTMLDEYIICLDEEGTRLNLLPVDRIAVGLVASEYNFQWYRGETVDPANEITGAIQSEYFPLTAGTYTVQAIHTGTGCSFSRTTTVVPSYPPVEAVIDVVSGAFSNRATIAVSVSGNGTYEYQLNTGEWQSSNTFTAVEYGTHIIRVRDTYSCGEISVDLTLTADYPSFFTPNGDGWNDSWAIPEKQGISILDTSIFDRHGKLIRKLRTGSNWDGTYNGKLMPSSDYWFKVTYIENNITKEFTSNFSLIR
ncbi:T9SS type B sorting domain-containing protein [Aquimarina sp. TRL1]|uniref:T9SS type B sorting domain-containing protein n=1 Tax=Aquimarina sp. (strain TRL1) TaxID=2736252 RepID=UPI00158C80C7|nr:choice-of-anchor L domain-containing protein [Aquimarina sp. TRL1]QKX07253.1 T9SS type B sorting domain-containing protein [Aquimarina sp. TRL1]